MLDLPVGSWLSVSKAVANTASNGSFADAVACHLFYGEDSLDFALAHRQVSNSLQQNYDGNLPLTAVFVVAVPSQVEVRCSEANDVHDAYLRAIKLVAVRVKT